MDVKREGENGTGEIKKKKRNNYQDKKQQQIKYEQTSFPKWTNTKNLFFHIFRYKKEEEKYIKPSLFP